MSYNPQLHHRRSIRLGGYDYSQAGAYFITICAHERECLFGKIYDGKVILNEIGKVARNELLRTPELRKNVELDIFVIMPNHIHAIVIITNDGRGELNSPSSQNESQDKLTGEFNSPLRGPSQTLGAIVRGYKSAVTKKCRVGSDIYAVWQRNYHEHIIRNEESYLKISDYIVHNPERWQEDKFFVGAN